MRWYDPLREEWMFENLDEGWALFRYGGEDSGNEILYVGRNGSFRREFVLVVANSLVNSFDIFGLERGFPDDKCVPWTIKLAKQGAR